jgi:ligand-binding sensor domain-containing protein/signal transduction histidine kinase
MEFEAVPLDEGVSHNLAFTLHQDATGFVWVGTMYGLARFDGRAWRTFRHDPRDTTSLSNDDVVCIAEDTRGDLWIGTYGGGLNRYDRTAGRFDRFLPDGPAGRTLSDGVVWDVAVDTRGAVWAATARGLDRVDPATGEVTAFRHDPEDEASVARGMPRTLAPDPAGGLWVGTLAGGLDSLDASGVFHHRGAGGTSPLSVPGQRVVGVHVDGGGALWVATLDGGLAFRPAGGAELVPVARAGGFASDLPATDVQCLAEDPSGAIWVGHSQGLSRVDPQVRTLESWQSRPDDPDGLRPGPVVAVLLDRSGVLWTGSYESGLSRAVPGGPRFARYGRDLGGRNPARHSVLSLAEGPDGTLWIGTITALFAREGPGGELRTFEVRPESPKGLPGPVVRALAFDAAGTLWVGTSGGLCRHDPVRGTFVRWPGEGERALAGPSVRAILGSGSGALWVGSDGGVSRIDPVSGDVTRFAPDPADSASLPDGTVLALFEDRETRLWVATYRGLSRLDPGASGFQHFRNDPRLSTSLGNNYVYAFYEAPNGDLWLGTGGGLDRLDRETGEFTHVREADGLPNAVVGSLLADNGSALWLGTQRGLARFDLSSGRVRSFDPADGLQSNLFQAGAALRLRDGTLAFGGPGGYNAFRPADLAASAPPPAVALTGLRTPRRPTSAWFDPSRLEELRLPSRESFFTFEFAALDTRRPGGVRYDYRLEGLDDDWVEAGSGREASYTGVPPGRYTFRVRATNADGIEGPATAVAVIVDPPLWRTPAFLAAAATLALAFALAAHAAGVRGRVRHALDVRRAREDEREAVRWRAAADFHDELGHRLARIGLFADLLERSDGVDSRSYLTRIAGEARHLADESRDFFWSLGADRGTAGELLARLERFGHDLFERTGVDFRVEGGSDELDGMDLPGDVRRNLASIFKEAMTNALRHAGCRAVVLRGRVEDGELVLALEDDGRGFPGKTASSGQGLRNMELRARKAGGTISIASTPGAGTRIALTRSVARPPRA